MIVIERKNMGGIVQSCVEVKLATPKYVELVEQKKVK